VSDPNEIVFHGDMEGLVARQGPDGGWFVYRVTDSGEELAAAPPGHAGHFRFVPEGGETPDATVIAGEILAHEIETWLDEQS
jgi:hypothetical protein